MDKPRSDSSWLAPKTTTSSEGLISLIELKEKESKALLNFFMFLSRFWLLEVVPSR